MHIILTFAVKVVKVSQEFSSKYSSVGFESQYWAGLGSGLLVYVNPGKVHNGNPKHA